MSWLAKAGEVILKGLKFGEQLLIGAQPLLTIANPKAAATDQIVVGDIEKAAGMITLVEATGQAASLPGTQKYTQAIPLIGQVVSQSTFVIGKKIQDQALYDKAIAEYTQATVDLANSFHPDVQTVSAS